MRSLQASPTRPNGPLEVKKFDVKSSHLIKRRLFAIFVNAMFRDFSYGQVVTMQIRETLKDQLDVCRLISNMVSDAR